MFSGPWSALPAAIRLDPTLAVAVDTCDLTSGETLQVLARGNAELLDFDVERGERMLSRYLGLDKSSWDPRFRKYLDDEPLALWIRLEPDRLEARDLSFVPSG